MSDKSKNSEVEAASATSATSPAGADFHMPTMGLWDVSFCVWGASGKQIISEVWEEEAPPPGPFAPKIIA